jgi:hypothetical protein
MSDTALVDLEIEKYVELIVTRIICRRDDEGGTTESEYCWSGVMVVILPRMLVVSKPNWNASGHTSISHLTCTVDHA